MPNIHHSTFASSSTSFSTLMGRRPVFRIWINAVVKLFKPAHKNLPSHKRIRLVAQFLDPRATNLLVKAIRCGGLQTDSFRCHADHGPPLRLQLLRCGALSRPETDSFRVLQDLSEPYLCDSEFVSSTMEYSTALSTQASSSSGSLVDCSCNHVDEIMPETNIASWGSEKSNEIMMEEEQSRSSYASARSTLSPGRIREEFKAEVREEPRSSGYRENISTANMSGTSQLESVVSRLSSRYLPACGAHILQHSNALVKYSRNPYRDFVSSISEMIVANELTHARDLEDLFGCYLHLNSPRHHSIITLAFVEATTKLCNTAPAIIHLLYKVTSSIPRTTLISP